MQGSIVWAQVADQQGRNSKARPAVIVTPTNEIVNNGQIVLVAVTSTLSPLPGNQVELPWKNEGHPVTGLKKRCVAICDWLVEINCNAIIRVAGVVPPDRLRMILANIPGDPGGINLPN
ncbi:MAG: type II toxin-antitoxin system PemK/MazF family toxin [Planctomycetales bacterium]